MFLPPFQGQSFNAYLAIEKRRRVNDQGESVAPNFEHFVGLLDKLEHDQDDDFWHVERLPTDFKQFFKCYERVEELHLWRISNSKSSS